MISTVTVRDDKQSGTIRRPFWLHPYTLRSAAHSSSRYVALISAADGSLEQKVIQPYAVSNNIKGGCKEGASRTFPTAKQIRSLDDVLNMKSISVYIAHE